MAGCRATHACPCGYARAWTDPWSSREGQDSWTVRADRPEAEGLDIDDEFSRQYDLRRPLAAGSRSVTYLATERRSGRAVVVKRPKEAADVADYSFLVGKRHPNIVAVLAHFLRPGRVSETCVVLEHCAGGDLFEAIQGFGGPPPASWSAAAFEQLLKAARYLHDWGECHNDIKPENVLLRARPSAAAPPLVVLCDFGCACVAGRETSAGCGGDPRYRAPETFQGAALGFATDAWSLGATLFELLSGGLLLHGLRNVCGFQAFRRRADCEVLMEQLREGRPVDLRFVPGQLARTLLRGLLAVQPTDRMSLAEATCHPWLTSDTLEDSDAGEGATSLESPSAAPAKLSSGVMDKGSLRRCSLGGC